MAGFICKICGSLGHGVSRDCESCHGTSGAATLAGNVLYFGCRIDKAANRLAALQTAVRSSLNFIFLLLGIAGFFALAYSAFLQGFEKMLTSDFWATPSFAILFFWLTVWTDMYLWYRMLRESERRVPVLKRVYEEGKGPELQHISWEAAAQIKKKNWIDISGSLTEGAVKALRSAYSIARTLEHSDVDLVHVFASLLATPEAALIFGRLGIQSQALQEKVGRALAALPRGYSESWFTPSVIEAIYSAYANSYARRRRYVDPTFIISAISHAESPVKDILYDLEIDERKIQNVAAWLEINDAIREKYRRGRSLARRRPSHEAGRAMTAVATPFLDQFGEDITLGAKYGRIFPVVGRDKEIQSIFRVLEGGRQSVLLVGNAGVGKSTLVEGIAERMVEEDVPRILQEKRLVSLSVSKIFSGASAGDAIGRLHQIFNEIARAKNIVLFIPNIHELVGVGAEVPGSLDLAEVVAAEINKGYFLVLGTTTPGEFRTFENMSLGHALEKVEIAEPAVDETIQILESQAGSFEYKSRVFFSYDAVEHAVTLSDKYLPDRFLPEKAIEVMQEVAHAVRSKRGEGAIVSGEDVAEIISEKSHVPVTKVTEQESEKLLHLEERMHGRIIGQSEAVKSVSAAIRRARAGLRSGSRPIANFLFLGPTGVGKTEMAKTVAEVYFGSEENMVRLDMSEYQDKASLYRLVGEPAGTPGGILTEAIRKQPFVLLLMDEIEKAHPDILNVFLQVMDDGRLTDNVGRTVDFTNVILIATSNAGTQVIQDEMRKGTPLPDIKNLLMNQELKPYFRPEFLNRFDGIIVFTPLSEEEIIQVAKLMLASIAKQMEAKGVTLKVTDEAVAELARAGFDPTFGARPLRRVLQERVQDALANFLLQKKIGRRDVVILEAGGNIRIEKAEAL